MDRIRLYPHDVEIEPGIMARDRVPEGLFRRDDVTASGCAMATLVQKSNDSELVRIRAIKSDDGRWMIKSITANLPKILFGSNGVCIKSADEYSRSLTYLRAIVGRLTRENCYSRILPGIGANNRGFIGSLEFTLQLTDRRSRVLLASHAAKFAKCRKPNGIYHGESTLIRADEFDFNFYDKLKEMKISKSNAPGRDVLLRIEARFNSGRCLAGSLQTLIPGPGQAAAAVSFSDAYAATRARAARLEGLFISSLANIPAKGCSQELVDLLFHASTHLPREMQTPEALVRWHSQHSKSCSRKLRNVLKALSASFAKEKNIPLDEIIPDNLRDFQWRDAPLGEWDRLAHEKSLRNLGIADARGADPDIVEGYSCSKLTAKMTGERIRLGKGTGVSSILRPWELNGQR